MIQDDVVLIAEGCSFRREATPFSSSARGRLATDSLGCAGSAALSSMRIRTVVSLLLISLVVACQGPMPEPSATRPSVAAVLHVVATSQTDSEATAVQHELWLQSSTNNVRYVSGPDGQQVTQIRNGRQTTCVLYGNRAVITIAETDSDPMLNIADQMLRCRSAVKSGSVSPVLDNGALRVQGDMFGGSYVARIDAETLLPLEDTFYGGEHVKWTYALVESIPAELVPSGLFDLAPPSEMTVESRAYLSLDDVKKFTDFPVYFLGSSYGGMDIAVIIHARGTGPGYARSSPTGVIERVEVIYQGNGQRLDVHSEPLATYRPRDATAGQVITTMNGSVVIVSVAQAMEAANHLVLVN